MLEEPMGSGCAITPANDKAKRKNKNDFFMELMFNSHSF
jgi:hypothetical protein